jgi:hypothetical protein
MKGKTTKMKCPEILDANQEDSKPDNSAYWQEYLRTPPRQIELPLDYVKQAGHFPER